MASITRILGAFALLAAMAAPSALAEPVRLTPEEVFRDHTISLEEAELRPLPRPPLIEVVALPNLRPFSVTEIWEAVAGLSRDVKAGAASANAMIARSAAENPPFAWANLLVALALAACLLATLRQITRMAGVSNTTTYGR